MVSGAVPVHLLVVLHFSLTFVTQWQTCIAVADLDTARQHQQQIVNGEPDAFDQPQHPQDRKKRNTSRKKRETDCPPVRPRCPDSVYLSKYRTPSGYCNNQDNPTWGMTGVPQRRHLTALYADPKLGTPRAVGQNGQPLPNPRVVSNTVHAERTGQQTLDPSATVMVMAWGQFLDHDITKTPMETASDGSPLDCCALDAATLAATLHVYILPACDPITIPNDDLFFRTKGQTCMHFARSVQLCNNCPSSSCSPEQVSGITSFVDASNVYGSTQKEMDALREFQGGRLKTVAFSGDPPGHSYLPRDPRPTPPGLCATEAQRVLYARGRFIHVLAGDTRSMEIPHLLVIHTLFLRYHNKIAGVLADNNPALNDEILYQEARRILGAINQKIAFKDYLPLVLGEQLPAPPTVSVPQSFFSGLFSYINSLFSTGGTKVKNFYQDNTDATISNAFATAAFRFGHSQVGNHQKRKDTSFRTVEEGDLSEHYFRPTMVLNGGVCGMSLWLSTDLMSKTDRKVSPHVRNNLFPDRKGHSRDLVALNIQRGRDHGLPPYNDFRTWCDLSRLSFVTYFPDIPDSTVIDNLKQLYSSGDDVDLFTGAMLETTITGAMVGPTFKCIIKRQFERLRNGDRFYYENRPLAGLPNVYFTEEQIKEIEKVTVSSVICETTCTTNIQPDAFHQTCKRGQQFFDSAAYRCLFGFCFCFVNNYVPCINMDTANFANFL